MVSEERTHKNVRRYTLGKFLPIVRSFAYNAISRWYSLHWKIIFNLYSNVLNFLSKKITDKLLEQLNYCIHNENKYSCKWATSSYTRVLFSVPRYILNTTVSMIRESNLISFWEKYHHMKYHHMKDQICLIISVTYVRKFLYIFEFCKV